MSDEAQYHAEVDMRAYREVVAPLLGKAVLDMHAHMWPEPLHESGPGAEFAEYLQPAYTVERLLAAASRMFPDQQYHAMVFGFPEPQEFAASNEYVSHVARRQQHMYPLVIPDMCASEEQIRQTVLQNGYFGFKPYWSMVTTKSVEDDVSVLDMLPEAYMRVADDWGLIIMLHIPGSQRLASQSNIKGIQTLSREYPHAKLVIAHLGRSYCPWSMKGGISEVCRLTNVYWDTSFVQESRVYQILFEHVDPGSVMYGTDLPLAEVRGRRVCINDSWVDVSRDHLSWTASRHREHPVDATFMSYEMIRAMHEGADAAGLSIDDLRPIFFENGMRLIQDVRRTLETLR